MHYKANFAICISIHTLRVEGDYAGNGKPIDALNFNPRPPREGRLVGTALFRQIRYFNPRPPRGGRRVELYDHFIITEISIHALRVEGDVTDCVPLINISQFQSTPSAWRATPLS